MSYILGLVLVLIGFIGGCFVTWLVADNNKEKAIQLISADTRKNTIKIARDIIDQEIGELKIEAGEELQKAIDKAKQRLKNLL